MRPLLLLTCLFVVTLTLVESSHAQLLGRGGGYGFNRPTGGYGFNRPTGGYGFNRPTGGWGFNRSVGPVAGVPGWGWGWGGYYPGYAYPVVGSGGVAYGFSSGWGPRGFYGPAGTWGGSGFMFPGMTNPAPQPKVYQSLQPKPASKDGSFTLPGSRSTLSFPTINTGRGKSRRRPIPQSSSRSDDGPVAPPEESTEDDGDKDKPIIPPPARR